MDSFHAHQPFQCLVNGTGWAALSCQFGTMFTTYDAASDQLTSAYNHEPRATALGSIRSLASAARYPRREIVLMLRIIYLELILQAARCAVLSLEKVLLPVRLTEWRRPYFWTTRLECCRRSF